MYKERIINELDTKIHLIEQKIFVIKQKLETCIRDINDIQTKVLHYSKELKREELEHKNLLSSPHLQTKANLQENRTMRDRITFHWRHMKYLESSLINLDVSIKNKTLEKSNLESQMNGLRLEQEKNIVTLNKVKINFSTIKNEANHDKNYNYNKSGTSHNKWM